MTATTDLIAELVRAANSLERASLLERRQLLTRAISAIRDMRDVARAASSRTADDNLINLATITASMERRRESEVRAAFLSSAEMLRDLRIVIDAKVEVIIGQIRV
ncbi:hypothetical protein P6U16_22370 (plasmid) [Rhizobium sp. 32-5/1]|uniref:hypothetical protein n=1 Tax=Rhizobium sp. 32-5/1 TaxID=3019602 RepID=UPI00240D669D|nr:hypothetical protein [Rhizobium sp. 32-5/1]WEZ85779.1 hypothetical protein P6U16_22370 [Rhizobium sp. 32-5/1]